MLRVLVFWPRFFISPPVSAQFSTFQVAEIVGPGEASSAGKSGAAGRTIPAACARKPLVFRLPHFGELEELGSLEGRSRCIFTLTKINCVERAVFTTRSAMGKPLIFLIAQI